MTLPIHTRLLMVAETLDGIAVFIEDMSATSADAIEEETAVLRAIAQELAED